MSPDSPIGFIGLGTMDAPTALNLVGAGKRLVVWNRTRDRCAPLEQAGATVASDAADLFARCETVILMLENDTATDAVLCRHGPDFASRVAGRTIVCMGTVSAGYSKHLSDDIRTAGGHYVEAPVSGRGIAHEYSCGYGILLAKNSPGELEKNDSHMPRFGELDCPSISICDCPAVSGSRKPAEVGQLVGMLAGETEDRAPAADPCVDLQGYLRWGPRPWRRGPATAAPWPAPARR